MAGFLYFVGESKGSASAVDLSRWQLTYAFTSAPASRGARIQDVQGLALVDSSRNTQPAVGDDDPKPLAVTVVEESQTWVELPRLDDGPRRWVGYWNEYPPTPEDLARPQQLAGYLRTDDEGRKWRLPLVRRPDDDGEPTCSLPTKLSFTPDGDLVAGQVTARYRELYDLTEAPWQALVQGKAIADREALTILGKILGANYVIDWPELLTLGCFSDEVAHSPAMWLAAAIGFLELLEWREAKGSDPTKPRPAAAGSTSSASSAA
ncbi:MAG: hypothetical protein AAFV43_03540 [Planctomycetota bacterium]